MSVMLQSITAGDDWAIDQDPAVLARIYEDAISISIWQRQLQQEVESYVDELLRKPKTIALKLSGSPEQLMEEIQRVFPPAFFPPVLIGEQSSCIGAAAFYADIHHVLDMFACLFDAKILGLRINTLEHAMCPRFHTDNVAIRLITTYYGLATEWLPDQLSNRAALGTAFASQINIPGAIAASERHIQRMAAGDVALFKGELWEGNEGRGIIHRSPAPTTQQPKRLVVTCDLIES
ncbi:DUF1826 domain-containing protein [Cellvibrio sp. KY-YJ-3]|uniref:DUF1826 domain-containing protein n=1 Tax=Cellvibrio sp. KY-YJ-3 TaxID=454662 RepID=UPI001244794C|nr:DUF1826 domain-containing protein [Cellvibrio sp. KY-YJ-3]QEY12370.1 DUF1826 domain-containing protein [Cellvibrio sp. KY-YJ-3]